MNIIRIPSAYFLVLCSMVLLLEAGCSSSTAPGTGVSPVSVRLPGDILSHYDMTNLSGIMYPREETYSIITHVLPASFQTNWDGTQSSGQANFYDGSGNPLDIGVVIFNNQLVNVPLASGSSGDYYSDSLPIYTDGLTENFVMVLPFNGTNGRAIDSLTFEGGMPSITNIVRGQNISRDSAITVNWTGTSDDYVSVSVFCWDSTGTHDTTGIGRGVGSNFKNTGTATIPANKYVLQLGLADVEIIRYQPKFITLSNGKRVAIICETCEEITVHIVD